MKNITIRQRILLSFVAILAVLVVMSGVIYSWLLRAEAEAINIENNTVPALYLSGQMRTAWAESNFLMGKFATQDNVTDLNNVADAIKANRNALQGYGEAYQKTVNSDRDTQDISQLRTLGLEYVAAGNVIMTQKRAALTSGQPFNAIAAIIERLNPIAERIDSTLTGMLDFNRSEANASTQRIASIVRSGEISLLLGALVALTIAAFCGHLLFRAITVPLGKLLHTVALMRKGDFTERLSLRQHDEFDRRSPAASTAWPMTCRC